MAGSRAIAFQGFDPVGRERSRTETRNGGAGVTTNHVYDVLGRLSSSVQTGGTAPFNQQFTYDSLGNILSITNAAGGASERERAF